MIPIHALLSRIRFDPEFGRARWEIAYLDRRRMGLVRLPLEQVRTQRHIGFAFDVVDEEGATHSIPYHRVRQVWRDGKLYWSRLAPRRPEGKPAPRAPTRKSRSPRLRPSGERR